MRFTTEATLRKKTEILSLNFRDQKLVECITKYFVLGITSIATTFIVIIVVLLDISANFNEKNNKIILSIISILIIIDIICNILCIYLQFNFAKKKYETLCHWFDGKMNEKVELIAVKSLREKTFAFYADKFDLDIAEEFHDIVVETVRSIDYNNNNDDDDDDDDPEKIPTFSSEMVTMNRVSSMSPDEDGNNTQKKEIMDMDFDKLIDYKALRKVNNSSISNGDGDENEEEYVD